MKGMTLKRRPKMNSCHTGPNSTLDLMHQLRSRSFFILKTYVVTFLQDIIHQSMKHQPISYLPRALSAPSSSYPEHTHIPSTLWPTEFLRSTKKSQHLSRKWTLKKEMAMTFHICRANKISIQKRQN